ncbi:MAG TPA: peroxiredoxin [Candidatus Limnocylindrales bacterium]|jgi:thioredoxin-dependent peroxiredoxin|nr:peroxiredoxin [Candidatus Limnocylindrales bacterium]
MDQESTPMPQVGQAAPELALLDDEGVERRLSDRRGQWTVVYFYPKDDTPGCTVEACEFRDANVEIQSRDAEVWGVSVLGTGSKAAFKRKFELPFVLLADEDHQAAEKYGTWVEKQNYGRTYMGIQRSTFLVDPEGLIRRVWPRVKPEGHAAEVLAALDEERALTAASQTTK